MEVPMVETAMSVVTQVSCGVERRVSLFRRNKAATLLWRGRRARLLVCVQSDA
jgi:hypothetical protein